MLERHRVVRLGMATLGLVLVAAMPAGCTPNPPEGRAGDGGAVAGSQPGGSGGGAGASVTTTTVVPTTTAQGRAASNSANICRGRADSFLPDAIAGYKVAASGDITGNLPPGAVGVQSAGAALVRREGENGEGLVSAVVFEERPALSAIASSTIDLFLQAAGGKADVTDTLVNGYEARTMSAPNGTTVIAWPECLNVWMIVQGPDAPMAADLAAKVHSP